MLRPADAISMHYIRSENMEELGDSIKEMLPKFKNSLQHLYFIQGIVYVSFPG